MLTTFSLRYAAVLLILIVPYVGLVTEGIRFVGIPKEPSTYGKEMGTLGFPEPWSAAYAGHAVLDRVRR